MNFWHRLICLININCLITILPLRPTALGYLLVRTCAGQARASGKAWVYNYGFPFYWMLRCQGLAMLLSGQAGAWSCRWLTNQSGASGHVISVDQSQESWARLGLTLHSAPQDLGINWTLCPIFDTVCKYISSMCALKTDSWNYMRGASPLWSL